ncbi:MAG TPA: glycosyltransferase family A protein [Chitinispirillaceae bacterium]|nr:glycosyltransferase family A protein [Chitinispirillaceae bacterium]
MDFTEILMITYNRPEYTKISLAKLIQHCPENVRIWIWHNGDHEETLNIVKTIAKEPQIFKFFHSRENLKLNTPTNWFWENSTAPLIGKVDDDCIVPSEWIEKIGLAHKEVPKLGVLSGWHFEEEDFDYNLARKKIVKLPKGHSLLQHPWVGGSGYLMKRACYEKIGCLKENDTFPNYCINIRWHGWLNGWYYPFIRVIHMDDPRAPGSLLKNDNDLRKYMPLTIAKNKVETIDQWIKLNKRTAFSIQKSPKEPKKFFKIWRLIFRMGLVNR